MRLALVAAGFLSGWLINGGESGRGTLNMSGPALVMGCG